MFKSTLFRRKKTAAAASASACRSFADFYNDWLSALSTALLPQLRCVLSSLSTSPSLLSTRVDAMHQHFISYYEALDQAAAADVAQCLYPDWRNSLEKPFLWFGDVHPYLLTNLLRSFLGDQESSQEDDNYDNRDVVESSALKNYLEGSWHVEKAWRSPSKALTTRVDQIECGLRLMVPALAARAREAQAKMVKNVMVDWGGKEALKVAVEEEVAAEMEELVGVVVDANRLRRSVLADVLSVTSVYQAASFLEALAEFLVGFREDKLVTEFEMCDTLINS